MATSCLPSSGWRRRQHTGKGLTKVPRDRTQGLCLGELAFHSPMRRSPLSSFCVASGLQRNRKLIFFYSVVLRFQKVSCQSMAGGPQPGPPPTSPPAPGTALVHSVSLLAQSQLGPQTLSPLRTLVMEDTSPAGPVAFRKEIVITTPESAGQPHLVHTRMST